jgi:hypothetical protein
LIDQQIIDLQSSETTTRAGGNPGNPGNPGQFQVHLHRYTIIGTAVIEQEQVLLSKFVFC